MSDLNRAYRSWTGKRLALALATAAAATAAAFWFILADARPLAVRIPAASIALVLAGLQGYLAQRTLSVVRDRRRLPLQVVRTRRREMRPTGFVCTLSLLILVALGAVPAPAPDSSDPIDLMPLGRRTRHPAALPISAAPAAPEGEETETDPLSEPAAPEAPAAVASGVAAPAPPRQPDPPPVQAPASLPARAVGIAEICPEIVIEPAHLAFDEIDRPADLFPALVPGPQAPAAALADAAVEVPGQDGDNAPFRSDREHYGPIPRSGWLIGLQYRPLPDENDRETLPLVEGRVEGFLLLGGGARVPGLTLALDMPVSPHDLLEFSWLAADLPKNSDVDRGLSTNWHHATLAYVRHLTGYTSQARFDLAVSLGANVDFFGTVKGVSDPGGPKFSPYGAADLSLWQENALGLLFHLGESLPWTLMGSSLGVTDFSAQLRWDLTERISLHGGYRVLLLHYKLDASPVPPGTDTLQDKLTGPMLGVDVRF